MSFLSKIDPEALSPEQKRVHGEIASGPRGAVRGPLEVWLRSPELADRAQRLGAFCRYGTSLPPRLSELAIILTAAHWRSGYEWQVHAPLARQAGVDAAAVEAIRVGSAPDLGGDDERAVHAFTQALLERKVVERAVWDRTAAVLGETAVVELVGILGYYALISMTINGCGVALLPGVPDPFPAA